MARLLGLLLCAAALAAAVALVPIGGRTVLDRWRASRGPADFASRSWKEAVRASGLAEAEPRRPPAHPPARKTPPVERHSDADRAELERIVSEHADGK